jgi:hypothetical protein
MLFGYPFLKKDDTIGNEKVSQEMFLGKFSEALV